MVVAVVAGAVVLGAMVAVALAALGKQVEEGMPMPATTTSGDQLPPPDREVARRTLTYLQGEAAAVLVMHRAAQDLAKGITTERCGKVAQALDRDAPLDQMLLAISGVEDEPLQAVLDAERVSLGATLSTCFEETPAAPSADDVVPLGEITAMVQTRLDALEAAR